MRNDDDHKVFQDDITQLQVWVDKWLPQFHPDNYKLLKRGKRTSTSQYTMYTDDLMTVPLYHVETSDENISMEIDLRAAKPNNIMGIIRRT